MIKKYLPTRPKKETALVQAQVSKELLARVKAIKEQYGWSWDEILTAYMQTMIDEFEKGDRK